MKSYALGKNHAIERRFGNHCFKNKVCPSCYQTRDLQTHLCASRCWTHIPVAYKCSRALPTPGVSIQPCNLWADAPIGNNLETFIFPPTGPLGALMSRSRMTLLLPVSWELWKISYSLQISSSMLAPKVSSGLCVDPVNPSDPGQFPEVCLG